MAQKTVKSSAGGKLHVPAGDVEGINPDSLLLDPHNLRLMDRIPEELQRVPVEILATESIQSRLFDAISKDSGLGIEALVQSILSSGFLRHESLIVAPFDGTRYLVLEGNRRLTAVRRIFQEYGRDTPLLPQLVTASLQTLPCFVLEGRPIGRNATALEQYRRASEVYVGIRHLMGAKSWDPASRYEFQNRLLAEGWSVDDVAAQFGRSRKDVLRDVKAHTLYKHFRELQQRRGLDVRVTFNAFAEAARARAVMDWLKWSDADLDVGDRKREKVFFDYLLANLNSEIPEDTEGEQAPELSAEDAVRSLRDMLKLGDADITSLIEKGDFSLARKWFEDRKEGDFERKIRTFLHALKQFSISELLAKRTRYAALLEEVQETITALLDVARSLPGEKSKSKKR